MPELLYLWCAMKYIVIETTLETGAVLRLPIIFPPHLVHKDVAEAIRHMVGFRHHWYPSKVVSAGTWSPMNGGECSGFSETLQLGPQPGDTELIRSYDYTSGFKP